MHAACVWTTLPRQQLERLVPRGVLGTIACTDYPKLFALLYFTCEVTNASGATGATGYTGAAGATGKTGVHSHSFYMTSLGPCGITSGVILCLAEAEDAHLQMGHLPVMISNRHVDNADGSSIIAMLDCTVNQLVWNALGGHWRPQATSEQRVRSA